MVTENFMFDGIAQMSAEGLSGTDFVRLKSAIDEAAIVAITDAKGVITYVNNKFCAISKYSKEELVGKTHKVVNSGFHAQSFFIDMWRTISSGKTWEGEIRNRTKDGGFYWVNTTIVPFMGSDGKPERYVAIRYEITQRILVEEQLKIQTRQLEMSNKELQDFASVAAHDLQEPLRKIQSFSDRLRVKAGPLLPVELTDYLERIQGSACRMQILINDLLSYSRVSTKTQPFATVDLNGIMAQVISDLEVRIESSQGRIEWSDLPIIQADASQMHQLLLNLVNNALKFHKPDVPPIVRVASRVIERGFGNPKLFEISVSDNGIGFEEKYLDRIFTIFQRLHGRNEYEGTGIGLSVCRKIVDRHGGRLTARSKAGEGATFIFTLPAEQNLERKDV